MLAIPFKFSTKVREFGEIALGKKIIFVNLILSNLGIIVECKFLEDSRILTLNPFNHPKISLMPQRIPLLVSPTIP